MKVYYEFDEDFIEAWKVSKEPWSVENTPYMNYFIQEGHLFKGHHLCIPTILIQKNMIKESHGKGLAEHIGNDKTQKLFKHKYCWPGLDTDVKNVRIYNPPLTKLYIILI